MKCRTPMRLPGLCVVGGSAVAAVLTYAVNVLKVVGQFERYGKLGIAQLAHFLWYRSVPGNAFMTVEPRAPAVPLGRFIRPGPRVPHQPPDNVLDVLVDRIALRRQIGALVSGKEADRRVGLGGTCVCQNEIDTYIKRRVVRKFANIARRKIHSPPQEQG